MAKRLFQAIQLKKNAPGLRQSRRKRVARYLDTTEKRMRRTSAKIAEVSDSETLNLPRLGFELFLTLRIKSLPALTAARISWRCAARGLLPNSTFSRVRPSSRAREGDGTGRAWCLAGRRNFPESAQIAARLTAICRSIQPQDRS
jgi:hypothetical protein